MKKNGVGDTSREPRTSSIVLVRFFLFLFKKTNETNTFLECLAFGAQSAAQKGGTLAGAKKGSKVSFWDHFSKGNFSLIIFQFLADPVSEPLEKNPFF